MSCPPSACRRWCDNRGWRSLRRFLPPAPIARQSASTSSYHASRLFPKMHLVRCVSNNMRHSEISSTSTANDYDNQPRGFSSRSKKFTHVDVTRRLSTKSSVANDVMDPNSIENDNIEEGMLEHYESLVQSGEVTRDPHQIRALLELERLRMECLPYFEELDKKNDGDRSSDESLDEEDTWSTGLFSLTPSWANPSTGGKAEKVQKSSIAPPRGVYLHGGVGCGKTYCMNLLYDALPKNMEKQKVHFHKFMLNVHKRMHDAKMIQNLQGDDAIDYVIQSTLSEGKILCFDEFQVTDVADALILRRLFTGLIEGGTVIVATSNRPPRDLYLGGLQRDLFLPFIDLLEERCTVISMWDSDVDYRLLQDDAAVGVYFTDDGDGGEDAAREKYEILFRKLTKEAPIRSAVLNAGGREVFVPKAAEEYGVARFSFYDLCGTAKGAADYLVVGERFHTVFVEDVPRLKFHEVNLVRRWITLVDAMYECHVKLVIHAATSPEDMFQVDLENEHCDEVFAFDRTRSRMEEMRSEGYLKKKWVGSRL